MVKRKRCLNQLFNKGTGLKFTFNHFVTKEFCYIERYTEWDKYLCAYSHYTLEVYVYRPLLMV